MLVVSCVLCAQTSSTWRVPREPLAVDTTILDTTTRRNRPCCNYFSFFSECLQCIVNGVGACLGVGVGVRFRLE